MFPGGGGSSSLEDRPHGLEAKGICALSEAVLSGARLKCNAPQAKRSFFVLRGDAPGSADEPVEQEQTLGRVVAVERDGRLIELDNKKAKMLQFFGW